MNFDIVVLTTGLTSLVGAIGLLLKNAADVKKAQHEVSSSQIKHIQESYSQLLDDRMKALETPMQKRIDLLTERVDGHEKTIDRQQQEIDKLKKFQSLFLTAVEYIRKLCHWIDSIEELKKCLTPKPSLPDTLRPFFDKGGGKNEATN